jgi:hypothetical protein
MTSDDRVVGSGDDGLDEAVLPDAPRERIKLGIADTSWIGGVGTELIDGYLLDAKVHRG